MKKLFALILMCCLSSFIFGQICPWVVNPFPFDSTSFENDTISKLQVQFDTTNANNIWQIGAVNKVGFDSAYIGSRALQTDTVLPYPINDTSAFYVWMQKDLSEYYSYFSLQWRQKYDVSNMLDSCIIQFSDDSGKNWQRIVSSVIGFSSFLSFVSGNPYDNNGQTFFTGKSNNWELVTLCFTTYTPKNQINSNYVIRFMLKSDSIMDNKPGWMIDDVKLIKPGVFSSIKNTIKQTITITPNPAKDFLHLSTNIGTSNSEICIYNLLGQCILQKQLLPNSTQCNLDISSLPQGMYVLKMGNGSSRFVKE